MPTAHHYEDAVLKGTALVLLDLPAPLRGAVLPLRKLFDDSYPHNGITHMLLNSSPVLSTSGEGVMECGAVFFKSAKATWDLLDNVEVVLRTEDGALELRRGYLKLGDEKILVEGVVTWGVGGRERPPLPLQRSPSAAAPPAPAPTPAAAQAPAPAPASLPASSQRAVVAASTGPGATSAGQTLEKSTVVVSIHFKEVYNRHRNIREEDKRAVRGELPSMFPLSPFMVHQMLLAECQPRKIVLIDSRRTTQQRVIKALVELASAEAAAHVVRVFTHRAVEFVSEAEDGRRPERGRGPLASPQGNAQPRPICAEVRYYLNAYYSTPNGQSRFHPNGERNYHRAIVVRHQEKDMMNTVDPHDAALVAVRAPREWQHDAHANRLASVPDADSPERAESGVSGERRPPAALPRSSHQHQREDRFDRRRRSPPARRGRSGRRSRSSSRSRSYSYSGSSSRSSSSPSRSSSRSSSRSRHFRGRPRREEARRDVNSRYDRNRPARGPERYEAPASTFSSVPPAATTISSQLFSTTSGPRSGERQAENPAMQPQPQQQQQPSSAAAQAVSAVPLPPPRVEGDALPPGWRPIFSEEYKQTYYAYRDPQTGAETTTWERPRA
ncbi:hypothetical protein ABB37_07524 [Leptomonas pyrrhocoris]|uniref:WW domain-containing protein n=1 Tax=Leptomonas pyrrhocoris TaxID=157538 RepID=A0A0M9FV30_LEPPY|nr:hypothetical protein ABB37_07524 [Leptomonas pyrrhocoris]KPA76675.1 hypothetical protein ABB37_07524 [Leptomonas pyrrhocoris]|eukprot:XP_015655114.1 hypothetical protein ABB37_07524 [Leptomonas pyrrhocoris]